MMIFGLISFFSGMVIFSLDRKHLLIMLLSLEFIIISLYYLMFIYLSYMDYEYYMVMFFMIMSVAEGVLGLSIMVSMIRSYGNDYIISANMLW